jgi:hypothetical protein
MPKQGKRQESSSFLKKRTKKLLFVLSAWCSHLLRCLREQKFFVSFFQKRKYFLASRVI